MALILVLGATGYVGSRLVPRLVKAGHDVRCPVRDIRKLDGEVNFQCDIVVGDLLKPETLFDACRGVDIVYYLVHSMTTGGKEFAELDRASARNVVRAAEKLET